MMTKKTILLFTVTAFLVTNLLPGGFEKWRSAGSVVVPESPTSEMIGMFDDMRTGLRSAPSGQERGLRSPIVFEMSPRGCKGNGEKRIKRSSTSLGHHGVNFQAWTSTLEQRGIFAKALVEIALDSVKKGGTAFNALEKLALWQMVKVQGDVAPEVHTQVHSAVTELMSGAEKELLHVHWNVSLSRYKSWMDHSNIIESAGIESKPFLHGLRKQIASQFKHDPVPLVDVTGVKMSLYNQWQCIRGEGELDLTNKMVDCFNSHLPKVWDLRTLDTAKGYVGTLTISPEEKLLLIGRINGKRKEVVTDAALFNGVLAREEVELNSDVTESLQRSVEHLRSLDYTLKQLESDSPVNTPRGFLRTIIKARQESLRQHALDSNAAVGHLGLFPGERGSGMANHKRKAEEVEYHEKAFWDGAC